MRTSEAVAGTSGEQAERQSPVERGARSRHRRFTIAIFTVAVLITGTLLLLHRPSAEVLVEIKADRVSFAQTAPFAPLRDVPPVAWVELADLAKVRQEGAAEIVAEPGEDLLLRIQPDASSKNPGAIGFDSLIFPAGAHIEFTQTGAPNSVELRAQYPTGTSPTLDLDISGDLLLRIKEQRKASFRAPVRITAIPTDEAQLVVTFRSPQVTFPSPVPVNSVSWTRDAASPAPHPGGVRMESSILSGTLSLEEFKERIVSLRNGELLHLGGASGLIRQLRLDGDAFSSQFDGSVKELFTGEGTRKRNLMPTWLDWLRQRDALLQFWAVALYLAGLGLAVGRWWREPK